jgi:lamin tail-like protein
MTEYRWGRTSGGDVPAEAFSKGHGWCPNDTDDGEERIPVWVARSLPDAEGAVRVGYVQRGEPAQEFWGESFDEYEVLLDEGGWREPGKEPAKMQEESGFLEPCGQLADGTPLYVTLNNTDGSGIFPEGREKSRLPDWEYVLVTPAAAAAPPPAAPDPGPPRPVAMLRSLELKGEAVEVANIGDAPLDLTGWKVRDESKGKPYVFPPGTIVAPREFVRVISGPGAAKPGPGELAWKTTRVWNDSGDTAFLEDPSGEVVDTRRGF